MRKIREVLRLHFELGMGQREIARACSISQSTVHEYLKAATAAGVSWPLPEGWEACGLVCFCALELVDTVVDLFLLNERQPENRVR